MATNTESQLAVTLVSGFQNSAEYNSLSPEIKTLLNQIIQSASENYATDLVTDVTLESNKQLDNIPNNLIGFKNPLDTVTGNLSSNDLSNTLLPSINDNLLGDAASLLTNNILSTLLNQLPPNLLRSIDIPNLTNVLGGAAKDGVAKGILDTLGSFSDNLFSNSPSIPPVIPNVEGISGLDREVGLDRIATTYNRSITNEALVEAQNFDTAKPDNEDKLITQTTGFVDPIAQYPTKEYAERTEVNKLATGDLKDTIVQAKELSRILGVQLPIGKFWTQPQVPYQAEYPYNKVYQTESGHIIEMDDTPGAERINIYHRSGTFVEIDPFGSIVKRTKGNNYEIIDRNGYVTILGDAEVSISGTSRIYVGANTSIEVEGDTNIKCLNDVTVEAAGNLNLTASEFLNLTSANINIEAYNVLNIKSNVEANVYVEGDFNLKSNTNLFVESLNFYNKSEEYYNQADNFYERVNESRYCETDDEVHFLTRGSFNVEGNPIHLNSGTTVGSKESKEAKTALSSLSGIIGPRKDIDIDEISDSSTASYLDQESYKFEDSENPSEAEEHKQTLKEAGLASDEDFESVIVELESNSPSSPNSTIISPSDSILDQTFLPENYQLSDHFTLSMLSSDAVVTKNPVVAQLGLSYGEIVYNLQGIALNICEPILAMYPNMFVTSAFRTARNSSSTSDHPRGKAVDIQFKNVSKKDYFDIAKKIGEQLNYDKLLLEYKTYGTGLPWIHISFDVNRQRKITLTYLNDKRYGDGLISLA